MNIHPMVDWIELEKRVSIRASVPLETCLERLKQAVDVKEPSFLLEWYSGDNRVIAFIEGSYVELFRRQPWYMRNDFAPRLKGELVEREGRTFFDGKWQLRAKTRFFMRIWLGFAVFWSVSAMAATIVGTGKSEDIFVFIAAAIFFPVIGWIFLNSAVHFSGGGKKEIEQLLRVALVSPDLMETQ